MKHSNVTRGQEEAFLNKIGGEAGLALVLADKMMLVPRPGTEDPRPKTEQKFLSSYQHAIALRFFFRGVFFFMV
ncbi:MAG TPA: hypothetical protein VJH55_02765 [Candidatus Paceibacterota bacterium]